MSRSRFKSKVLAIAASGALVFGGSIATVVTWAGTAQAASQTCTNTQPAVSAPYGCGGLTIAQPYPFGALAISTNGTHVFDSKQVVVEPASTSALDQDLTVFAVGGSTTDGPGGLGIYVAAVSPGGRLADFKVLVAGTPQSPSDQCITHNAPGATYTNAIPCAGAHLAMLAGQYCLSVANFVGPNGKLRWWAILRLCSTNGTFIYGTPTAPGSVSFSFGNWWQMWGPIIGSNGLLMENISLFNHFNSEYDLNITGARGAGAPLQAYQDNTGGVINDQWDYQACTPPGTLLSVFGIYGSC